MLELYSGAFMLSSPATWPPQTLWTYFAGVLIVLPDLVVAAEGPSGVDGDEFHVDGWLGAGS